MTQSIMIQSLVVLILALVFAGCSKSSIPGTYQTVGSEDKFQITLEMRPDGQATIATRSNLGRTDLDQAVQATMALRDGRWSKQEGKLQVTGKLGDGKPTTFGFMVQPNGDLMWDKNGARLVKVR